MDPVVLAAASCLLQIVETELERTDDGWLETTHVEAAARPSCEWLAWPLPPGVTFEGGSGKARLGDGTRRKIVDARWTHAPRGLDGRGEVRLHLTDLLGGDRIVVDIERRWPAGGLDWSPGPFRYAALELDDDVPLEVEGLSRDDRDRFWRAAPADERTAATIAGGAPVPEPPPLPVGNPEEERRLTLLVPGGDPQIALFPGGGSALRVERFLTISAAEHPRGLVLDVPADADVSLESQPRDIATVERQPGLTWLQIEPSEADARIAVAWEEPDAPTFGQKPPGVNAVEVDAPGGAVDWEGDAWRLVGMNRRPVLPVREVLLKALDHRFRSLSLPEPGAPMELRGLSAGWELAAELRPTLFSRAAPAPLDIDPLFPRKLVKARRSGVVSRTEAALILWLYARQLRLRADWALVRPATAGPGPEQGPAGYTEAVVRIEHDGEVRWIDPVCRVCAPFELPPHLQGADVLSLAADRTPAPAEGSLDVVVTDEGLATWTLSGPPALLLRSWLLDLPAARTRALAERLGGPGARLVQLEGLGEAGAEVVVVVAHGDGVTRDPLALPVPDGDDTAWLDWIGTRTVRWPHHAMPEVEARSGPLAYRRFTEDGVLVEELVVEQRLVQGPDLRVIDQARWGTGPEQADVAPPVP